MVVCVFSFPIRCSFRCPFSGMVAIVPVRHHDGIEMISCLFNAELYLNRMFIQFPTVFMMIIGLGATSLTVVCHFQCVLRVTGIYGNTRPPLGVEGWFLYWLVFPSGRQD